MASRWQRTWSAFRQIERSCRRDRVSAESARLAFYFFLSLFPCILALFALTGLVGGENAFAWIMDQLRQALPVSAAEELARFVLEATSTPRPGTLSVGVLLALWLASNIFSALADGLNAAYRVSIKRKWWQKRARALLLLTIAATGLLAESLVVVAGPEMASLFGFRGMDVVLRWPLTFCLSTAVMGLCYYVLPNHDGRRSLRRILAGALVGTTLWILATILFRWYLRGFGRITLIYGFLGGFVVLQIWLYLTAASILVGGEVAAVLERRRASQREGLSP